MKTYKKSIIPMENDFIAIDVETAQGKRWSICQIGLVIVENGEIKETVSKLVQPPNNEYSPFNIRIHKITPEETLNSPYFNEVWESIFPIIENKKLVAHNASFDISCLNQTLDYYNIEKPDFKYDCTYKLTGEKLKVACKKYDISLENHHDALCDAKACANLFLKLKDNSIPKDGVICQTVKQKKHVPYLPKDNSKQDFCFEGRSFCFTGKMAELTRNGAEKEVRSRAGLTQNTINKHLDYLVIGSIASSGWKFGNYGNKIEKALELIEQGAKLKILPEDSFMLALENYIAIDSGEIDQKFLVFRFEALFENGETDIESLEHYLNSLKDNTNSHIVAKFEDPNILQALYGAFEGYNLENFILFKARIVKQFTLNTNVQDFVNSLVNELNSIKGIEGEYTYSEKKEGTAGYAKLFKEIPSNINLKL